MLIEPQFYNYQLQTIIMVVIRRTVEPFDPPTRNTIKFSYSIVILGKTIVIVIVIQVTLS